MRFSVRMIPEIDQGFWQAMADGAFFTDAVVNAGVDRRTGSAGLPGAAVSDLDAYGI